MESENFISTVCRSCSFYFKSSLAQQSKKRKVNRVSIHKRELTCADCGAVQMVAEEAQSSTCLECGRHLELGHRLIEGEHLGNLSLEGELQIGPKGNQLKILEGASLEAGDLLSFESGEVDGELRCETISIAGMLRVGPRGRVVAQKIVFGELTVEVGGRLSGYGEVKAKPVEARKEPPLEAETSETSK